MVMINESNVSTIPAITTPFHFQLAQHTPAMKVPNEAPKKKEVIKMVFTLLAADGKSERALL